MYFTVLIELIWDKERIMEVYLNSIEMGDGIYGAEAVAKAHFHTTAAKLTRKQCALIAASLPNPRKFNSGNPSPYMYKRQRKIMYLMKCVPTFPAPENNKASGILGVPLQNGKSYLVFHRKDTGKNTVSPPIIWERTDSTPSIRQIQYTNPPITQAIA